MKKLMRILSVILVLCGLLAISVCAAPEGPVITMQPQSPNYPEYSIAIYTVKATGTNLSATWYIEWEGKTYTASNIGGAMQAWEPYAGESYGAKKLDSNTFAFIFEGIEHALNGATIWCVIDDGHNSVTSQKAYINMGNPATPPEILSFPAEITVEQGKNAEIRCVARSNDETQLGYIWYETSTGDLQDIQAMDRGTEFGDSIICDTSKTGTRYYACAVNTSNGGITYSSVVPVTVTPKTVTAAPEITTDTLPQAVAGEAYCVQLSCSDPNAQYCVYNNPGKDNDFDKTGLTLGKDGKLSGTPTAAGSYTFCICAAGAGGEDYAVYTLTVAEPSAQPTAPTEQTQPTGTTAAVTQTQPDSTNAATSTTEAPAKDQENPSPNNNALPWWAVALIGLAAAGVGVGVAVLLVKRKS